MLVTHTFDMGMHRSPSAFENPIGYPKNDTAARKKNWPFLPNKSERNLGTMGVGVGGPPVPLPLPPMVRLGVGGGPTPHIKHGPTSVPPWVSSETGPSPRGGSAGGWVNFEKRAGARRQTPPPPTPP